MTTNLVRLKELIILWLLSAVTVCILSPINKDTIADVDSFSGKACDIWALGVTLYCMVYNVLPFFDENEFKLLEKIHSD